MNLSQLKKERRMRAPKIVIYSGPKAGKSTWASQAPDPIFIQCEEGLDALDVVAIPQDENGKPRSIKKLQELFDCFKEIYEQEHNFKTLVIDSLDWLEPHVNLVACKDAGLDHINDVSKGYGKGGDAAKKIWKRILDGLDMIRDERGMAIILICHSDIRTAVPTDSEAYDFHDLKLTKKASSLVTEWADVISFAVRKRIIKETSDGFNKSGRAVSKGDRVLIVGENPAYVTGNRYGLPDELPLNFSAFAEAMNNI